MNHFNIFHHETKNNVLKHVRNYKLQKKIQIDQVKAGFQTFLIRSLIRKVDRMRSDCTKDRIKKFWTVDQTKFIWSSPARASLLSGLGLDLIINSPTCFYAY